MGELKVLPLNDIRDLKGVISREFRLTGEPVSIPALASKMNIKQHKLRSVAQGMGWIGRPRKGFAPKSYWDALKSGITASKVSEPDEVSLTEKEFEAAVVHVPEEQSDICLATMTLEAYYVHIRGVWDELRHATSDPNLKDLQEDIMSFKETTRQHLCEVMKKL